MKINPKSEKGAVTIIVLVAMLFLTALLMSMYIRIANKAQTSAETTKQIEEKYNNIGEAEDIYNSYFSNSDLIPIYTREQLEKIGSGEQVTVNGKIYTFSTTAYYTLQNDLDLGGYYDETTGIWTVAEGEEWTPLPDTFIGVLDGLGHTISGIYINKPEESNQGLFGTLKGTVKNLRMINGYINGKNNIGAIAGINNGIIENCYEDGIIMPGVDLSLVKVGDYISNYPVEYTNVATSCVSDSGEDLGDWPRDEFTGWRVLSKETDDNGNTYVRLVSAGVPIIYYHPNEDGGVARSVTNLTTGFLTTEIDSSTVTTPYKFYKCGFKDIGNNTNLSSVFANSFTDKVQALTKEDVDAVVGETTTDGTYVNDSKYADLLAVPCKGDNLYSYANVWLASPYDSCNLWILDYCGEMSYYSCGGYGEVTLGVRVVVSLKFDVQFTPAIEKINDTTTWKIR